jgi:hypothetical protein
MQMSKRLLIVGIVLVSLAATALAQELSPPDLERLGLSQEQRERVEQLVQEHRSTIQESRLELEVIKAQLRRLLFEQNVDMGEVKRLLRESLDWEYRQRLAQIELQVELRRLLGEERYARLREHWNRRRRIDRD